MTMTNRKDLLDEVRPSKARSVMSATGQVVPVHGEGRAVFMGADGRLVGLKRVLFVPGLCANLLSTKALSEAGMKMEVVGTKSFKATLGERILWDLRGDKDMHQSMWEVPVMPWKEAQPILAKGAARSNNAQHVGDGAMGEGTWGDVVEQGGAAASSVTPHSGEADWLTVHRRLGHVAFSQLKKLLQGERVKGLRVKGELKEVGSCETCLASKFSRFSFDPVEGQTKDPVELVHMDLWGPLRVRGDGGASYSLTIVDDWSRLTWSYPIAKKSDAAGIIMEEWLPLCERETGKKVKAIRTDRGGEFMGGEFRSWMRKMGIKHQLPPPGTPQANGVAERANRTVLEGARGVLVESGLPLRFWPHAVRHTTVVKNRLLTKVGGQEWVPMERWTGRKPLVDMLRVFGCMGFALIPKMKRDKLDAAAVEAVHLGLAKGCKGWLMWDPQANSMIITRDVKFMEGMVYKRWLKRGSMEVSIPLDMQPSTKDSLLLPVDLSSSTADGAEQPNADEEAPESVEDGEGVKEADASEEDPRGDDVVELTQPTPPPTLPPRRVRRVRFQANPTLSRDAPARERPARTPHPREKLQYEVLGGPSQGKKALMVHEEGGAGWMEEADIITCFASNLPHEPASMEEALAGEDQEAWLAAREEEYQSHMENGTWSLTNLPPGRKALDCTWVLKVKTDGEGRLERRKARLVVKGFQQREGIDFQEVFAPVAKAPTLRVLLAAAAVCGWKAEQMDVKTAFLYGVVEEEIYMKQPEGYDDGSGRVCKLHKALYGLKQAPRCWYARLVEVLEALGFTVSGSDESLFFTEDTNTKVFLLVYVDDIILFSKSLDRIKEVQGRLKESFQCKAMGPVGYYLGLHIERDMERGWLKLHQHKYLKAMGEKYGLEERRVATPLPDGFKLHHAGEDDEELDPEKQRRYQSIVGSLMYAGVNTRPDIACAVAQLARVVSRPLEEHVEVAERLVRYCSSTSRVGLMYSVHAQLKQRGVQQICAAAGTEPVRGRLYLSCFTDATLGSESIDASSQGGYLCCVGGSPVSWRSKKQGETAHSTSESEYMALFHGIKEVVWLRRLLEELGQEQEGPTPVFCDCQGAIAMAKNAVLHGLNKHMHIKWHWVRKEVKRGTVSLHYVRTTEQPADFLTKRLSEPQHWKLAKLCGMSLN